MFDFGWAELLLVAVVILFAVGPNDIPKVMYQCGRALRRLHYLKFALSQQFDDFMQKAETQQNDGEMRPLSSDEDDTINEAENDEELIVSEASFSEDHVEAETEADEKDGERK